MDEKLSESEMAYDLITTRAENYPTSETEREREMCAGTLKQCKMKEERQAEEKKSLSACPYYHYLSKEEGGVKVTTDTAIWIMAPKSHYKAAKKCTLAIFPLFLNSTVSEESTD